MDNQIGLINIKIDSLITVKNDTFVDINMKMIKNRHNFGLNIFTCKRFNKLIEYYKLLICYVYLNSEFENNERRLYYNKKIEQNKSIFNQYTSWLNDIDFNYFSILHKDKVNYFILKIDKSFENEIKEFIEINKINSNEKLLKLLEIYIKISNN